MEVMQYMMQIPLLRLRSMFLRYVRLRQYKRARGDLFRFQIVARVRQSDWSLDLSSAVVTLTSLCMAQNRSFGGRSGLVPCSGQPQCFGTFALNIHLQTLHCSVEEMEREICGLPKDEAQEHRTYGSKMDQKLVWVSRRMRQKWSAVNWPDANLGLPSDDITI